MGSEKPDPFDGTLRQIENHARAARGELAVLNAELSALRAENARMREALEKCRDVLAGHTMTKQELIDALRRARAALGGRDEGS